MEAKIDELRAKAIASLPNPNPNPPMKSKSPSAREEGELSPSEDTGIITCSTTPPHDSRMSGEPNVNDVQPTSAKSLKSGVNSHHTCTSMTTKMQQLQRSVALKYNRCSKTKRAPYKSNNNRKHGWVRRGLNNDLVISFSDDESGSGSEECKRKRSDAASNCKVLTMPTHLQSEILQGPPFKRAKQVRRKDVINVSSISTTSKTDGDKGRCLSASAVKKDPYIQRNVHITKDSASPESELACTANLADHRLENLRHQIAVRENELKVQNKTTSQKKDAKGLYGDDHRSYFMKQDAQFTEINLPASSDTVRLTPKEQSVKCVKLDQHVNGQLSSCEQAQMDVPFIRSCHELDAPGINNSGCWLKDTTNSSYYESDRNKLTRASNQRADLQHQEASVCASGSESEAGLSGAKDKKSETIVPVCQTPSFTIESHGIPLKLQKLSKISAGASCSCDQSQDRGLKVDSNRFTEKPCLDPKMFPVLNGPLHCSEAPLLQNSILPSNIQSNISKENHASPIFPDNATGRHELEKSQQTVVRTESAMPSSTLTNTFEKLAIHIPMSKLDNEEQSVSRNAMISNCLSQTNILGEGTAHLQSLKELEDLHDKELEEAQELRRRCEIEERRTLKAYREAQIALVHANEQCNLLYRKRELVSVQAQVLMMEASRSMCPSSWQGCRGPLMDFSKTARNSSLDMLPSVEHQVATNGIVVHQLGYQPGIQCPNGAVVDLSRQHSSEWNVGSEQCDARNGSCLEHKDYTDLVHAHASVDILNLSAANDKDNVLPEDRVPSRLPCDIGERNHMAKPVDEPSNEGTQDYELEASLRSQLVARFRTRPSSKSNDGNSMNIFGKGVNYNNTNEKLSPPFHLQLQEGEKNQLSSLLGTERQRKAMDHFASQTYGLPPENSYFLNGESDRYNLNRDECNKVTEHGERRSFSKESSWPSSVPVFSLPSSGLHIVSRHANLILPGNCNESHARESDCLLNDQPEEAVGCPPVVGESLRGSSERWSREIEVEFDQRDIVANPFWPFCMFELRGRCNNEECSWQHFKKLKKKIKVTGSDCQDCQVGHPVAHGKSAFSVGLPYNFGQHYIPIPTYQIGFCLMKADSHLSKSIMARSSWQYWRRGFSNSCPLPFSIDRILPPDSCYLQSGDGHVADEKDWNRPPFHFRCLDGILEQAMQGLTDCEQSVELALDIFEGRFYRPDRKKALLLLSRAIEAYPNSVVLWVVYLHIYYCKEKHIGNDDMFFHAVRHNEGSYELWLMYINSRIRLGDRLDAYISALKALCHNVDATNKDKKYASACILDVFLQMVDFLCMSDQVDKALNRIYRLVRVQTNSDDTLLFDVNSKLVRSDSCIFWFCCVYLTIYRVLPEAIVRQFEFEKELPFEHEWPSTQIANEEKDWALEILRFALDNVAVHNDDFSCRNDLVVMKPLHFLAVFHLRCVAALEGSHSIVDLFAKYMTMFPTCIELVLMSARLQDSGAGFVVCRGFDEAVFNWPKEVAGIQCLWNQYAEYNLQKGRVEDAEKVMDCWFQDFCDAKQDMESRDTEDGKDNSVKLPSLLNHSTSSDNSFMVLNLFLYEMLNRRHAEAYAAVDKALKLTALEDFRYCVREHAAFVSFYESSQNKDIPGFLLGLLKGYLSDCRSSLTRQPLSRRYYQDIKKPRVRQLINGFLGPSSLDHSLVNSVLEVCYGPSLLPEKFNRVTDLVNFVEPVMEITPANYPLALCVCKFTRKNFGCTGVASDALMFWAITLLVNSIFEAVPSAPERFWLETANILENCEIMGVALWFHQLAISVYPFSLRLWQSYLNISRKAGDASPIIKLARERGIELGEVPD